MYPSLSIYTSISIGLTRGRREDQAELRGTHENNYTIYTVQRKETCPSAKGTESPFLPSVTFQSPDIKEEAGERVG